MDSTLLPHILFADSDALLCVTARRALQERHFAITIAHDGSEALDRLARDAYDVVVLGLSLRLVNAIQVLREIKAHDPTLPVVFLKSNQGNDISTTGNEGAFAIVNAPIANWDTFSETLNQAMQSRGAQSQTRESEKSTVSLTSLSDADVLDTRVLPLLHLLANMTRGVHPLAETMDVLLQASTEILETDHAELVLVEADRLRMYRVFGMGEPGALPHNANLLKDETFTLRVISARRTLVETNPARANTQMLGTPLIARDQVLGVLIASALPNDPIAPERVRWLELFAAYGGVAIELERLTGEYEQQLPTDPVTETLKRAPFLDLADREFRRAWRYNQPITAIFVHLDNLAEIRSTGGNGLAENALKLAALTCRSVVRSIDLLCRYEDDAFAVLLLMTTGGDARHVAERLRNNLAALELEHTHAQMRVTASLGVCPYPREGCSSIFDLLSIAQEAQHAARRGGANQIVYV